MANAKAQVAEAQIALGYCELRAPFDSWVIKRSVDVGTLVGPATNGFTLADTRSVKAVFGVPDTAMEHVKLGSHAECGDRGPAGHVFGTHHLDFGRGGSEEPGVFRRSANRQSGQSSSSPE